MVNVSGGGLFVLGFFAGFNLVDAPNIRIQDLDTCLLLYTGLYLFLLLDLGTSFGRIIYIG